MLPAEFLKIRNNLLDQWVKFNMLSRNLAGEKIMKYVWFMGGIFAVSILVGFLYAVVNQMQARVQFEKMSEGFGFIRNLNYYLIFLFIFLNNSIKSFFVLFLGFFFGIIPIYFVVANGELIGLVLGVSYEASGWDKLAIGLLPHGIFEIPALILTSSYGMWLGIKFYERLRFKKPFAPALNFVFWKYLRIILPMLLIAALIETFVTTALLKAYR